MGKNCLAKAVLTSTKYTEEVLTSTHYICFEQKYEYQNFLSENFHHLVVKFSVYLNRHVLVNGKHFISSSYSRVG